MKTAILAMLAACAVFGQDAPAEIGDDPPGRAARLSYIAGSVSFQPGGAEEWIPAPLNRPVTTGDRLWTEPGARAELHSGSAAIRLNQRTNFTLLNLNDSTTQIQVSVGTVSVRLRRLDENETFEIDTPQAAFTLLRPGEYRVDVNEAGDATLATVRAGEADAAISDTNVIHIRPRLQVRIATAGDDAPANIDERDLPVADTFDNFCSDRDRREDRSESVRHVSRDVPGVADLDAYGTWREEPDYGWIWAPRAEIGWAPYHYGHWAWIAPWGWTWVDDAPWGYAPFHYGRWASIGGGWVWVPGPVAVRPMYAPALVAWVGGPRFSVSLAVAGGGSAVGWFPLAPGEVWVPSYRSSPRYFNQVNVSNTVVNRNVNITNVYNNVYVNRTTVGSNTYVNQNVNGAVAAVPQSAMTAGRPVSRAALRVPQNAIAAGEVQQSAQVTPQREAVLSGTNASAAAPPAFHNRAIVARATPPAAPTPFSQQPALQLAPGQPAGRYTPQTIPQSDTRPAIRQLRTADRPSTVSQPRVLQPAGQQTTPSIRPQTLDRTITPNPSPQPRREPVTTPRPQIEPRTQTEPRIQAEPRSQPEPRIQPEPRVQPNDQVRRGKEGRREPRDGKNDKRDDKK